MPDELVAGIDLGGTNLRVATVDRDARVVAKQSAATDASANPETVIQGMIELVDRVLSDTGRGRAALVGVGIGAPGPLDQRAGRIIRSANLPRWVDVPINDRIVAEFGVPTLLENDANAAAYGEFWAGAGRDGADLVLLTLGTGVGAGVVLGGRVLQGHFQNAAELGHMIVVPDGLPCPCGQRGCLEQYASASSVARRAAQASRGLEPARTSADTLDAETVSQRARAGDVACLQVWNETCKFLGIACVNIQHAFNAARIVLAGGLANAGDFLLDGVRRDFDRLTWKLHSDRPAIELARLGDDAGVIGAAGLAWANTRRDATA